MPAIIAALVAALMGALREYLPKLVGRLLLAIGIGLAVNKVAVPDLLQYIEQRVGGMPGVLAAYFKALGMDVAVTMTLSAMAANAAARVFIKKL